MSDILKTLDERHSRYGTYMEVAKTSQLLKEILAEAMVKNPIEISHDMNESLDMICNKLSRIVNGDPNYDDSWHDIAGYATLISERLRGNTK